MIIRRLQLSTAVLTLISARAFAVTYDLGAQMGLIEPSTRGSAGTTFYGWDTFNDPATRAQPIDDHSPDMGTPPPGAQFRTTNGEDHVLGSGNFYLFAGNPAEEVTAVTNGLLGTGFTSIIIQGITSLDAYPGPWNFATVNGVSPSYAQGVNAAGLGQFWIRYDFTGNDASYVIPFSAAGPHFSLDRFTVDTYWSAAGFSPDDAFAVPEPAAASFLVALGALRLRRKQR